MKGHNFGGIPCKKCGKIHINPMYGRNHSEESKKQMSKSKIGIKNPKLSETLKRLYSEGKLKPSFKGKHHTKETKEIMRLKKIGLYIGEKNPFYKKNHTEETKRIMSLFRLGKPNLKLSGIPKSEEHRRNISKSKLGKPLPKVSETLKRLYSEGKLISPFKDKNIQKKCHQHKIPNKPEKQMIKIIKENNLPFNYTGNGAIWFRGQNHSFNPDFLSKNPKHIIEIFGDYWHNLLRIKKRDIERIGTYKKYGYKTLVIWENELKNPNQVIEKINKFVGGN